MTSTQKVIFITVSQNREKLKKIQQIVTKHFNAKVPLLILTPNSTASEYVDQFLWNTPIHSFIPHSISTSISEDLICITHRDNINPNKAKRLLNLTGNPLISPDFNKIYDFDDNSSKNTQNLSQKKIESYRKEKFAIISS